MKTVQQLRDILLSHQFCKVDAHIHTHLCDGDLEMTVQNIAKTALKQRKTCVILVPHFHKQVSDDTATLYTDTHEEILIKLREEIDAYYAANGTALTILLSTEADILDTDGNTALNLTRKGEDALDLVTPTVNYHPLLPLKAVEVTYCEPMVDLHKSGRYKRFAEQIGGTEKVLESLYETEVNAILRCPYPCMLGHFWAAHTYVSENLSWFGAGPEHTNLIRAGSEKILDACQKTGAMIDLTGLRRHYDDASLEAKRERDGFFFAYQRWFLNLCRQRGIIALPGTDSHTLHHMINDYYQYFTE